MNLFSNTKFRGIAIFIRSKNFFLLFFSFTHIVQMEAIYDQIEIEDFEFDSDRGLFLYPCPCGDKFQILLDDLLDNENIAVCPTCSLQVEVIFEPEDLEEYKHMMK